MTSARPERLWFEALRGIASGATGYARFLSPRDMSESAGGVRMPVALSDDAVADVVAETGGTL